MGRPKMLGDGAVTVRATLTAGQLDTIRVLQAAELAAAGVEPPRAEVIRRALDAGLPALERGDAPGFAAAPASPDGPTLADVLAEVRALRGDLVAVAEAPTVRAVSEDAGTIGLLIGGADNLEAAVELITRACYSLAVHTEDVGALLGQLSGVRAAAAEVRDVVRKLERRAVAPAPASAPRTPEHDPAQLDIERDAAELAGGVAKPEPEERRHVDDSLGVALAAWMTEHDVGSTVAARLMGVSQGMVSHWYLGNRRISPKHRAKVEALIATPPPAEG